jgi:hypothetical protein
VLNRYPPIGGLQVKVTKVELQPLKNWRVGRRERGCTRVGASDLGLSYTRFHMHVF